MFSSSGIIYLQPDYITRLLKPLVDHRLGKTDDKPASGLGGVSILGYTIKDPVRAALLRADNFSQHPLFLQAPGPFGCLYFSIFPGTDFDRRPLQHCSAAAPPLLMLRHSSMFRCCSASADAGACLLTR